jgi:hypothetical protein
METTREKVVEYIVVRLTREEADHLEFGTCEGLDKEVWRKSLDAQGTRLAMEEFAKQLHMARITK